MGNKIKSFEYLIFWQKAVDMERSVNTIFPICKNHSSKTLYRHPTPFSPFQPSDSFYPPILSNPLKT